jgi:hypothetical protein
VSSRIVARSPPAVVGAVGASLLGTVVAELVSAAAGLAMPALVALIVWMLWRLLG